MKSTITPAFDRDSWTVPPAPTDLGMSVTLQGERDSDRSRSERGRTVTDYNNEYENCECVCGAPFQEFVEFFEAATGSLSVLDLGCGQGRDALMAARYGHKVHGVDSADAGIAQMVAIAKREGLSVVGQVGDFECFETRKTFDAVVLDRVLHMLKTAAQRTSVLKNVVGWVVPGGHALVADTKRNRALIRDFFSSIGWEATLKKRDFLFVKKPGSAVSGRRG